MCLNNCLMMQQNCHASCGIQMQQCSINNNFAQQQARDYAEDAFRDYVRERRAQGKLIKKDRDNFYSDPSQPCADDACHGQCGGDYNMCYSNCGGQVIAHTACIANCNLQQP